jgi:hypothetical protein
MCLVVKNEKHPIQIATKDIKVWKIIREVSNSSFHWEPVEISGTGDYKCNEVLKARKLIYSKILQTQKPKPVKLIEIESLEVLIKYMNDDETILIINEGFHSHVKKQGPRKFKGNRVWRRAIIPAGSEYSLGNDNDIVSSRIIVFSNFWYYITYRLIGRIW